jgi:beta-lactamase superfamily II metal-dependent hydrolase
MKLMMFQSDKGDCLLLIGSEGTPRILVDGGMRDSYKSFVAPALAGLAANNQSLDLVYVSHIDRDHISGVLQLLDDMMAWRVHDFQIKHANPTHPPPRSGRPPSIGAIWHNAFNELIEDDTQAISEILAASAAILSGASDAELLELATEHRELATSVPEAIKLSHRISPDQLGIALNEPFGGKLAFVRSNEAPRSIQLGSLKISVIGPFETDLDKLRRDWGKWLTEHPTELAKLQKQALRDAERLGASDAKTLLTLRSAPLKQLGDRSKVTPPNLASLMLLVEENDQTLLLTGDGHGRDILNGLAFHHKLNDHGQVHVNLLKVQHHGGEHNIDREFVSKVSADHYLFCGNGQHENPNLEVLKILMDSRIGNVSFLSTNPQASGPFKLWFNSSESASKRPEAKLHMRQVRELVEQRKAESAGRMTFEFLEEKTPSFEINT